MVRGGVELVGLGLASLVGLNFNCGLEPLAHTSASGTGGEGSRTSYLPQCAPFIAAHCKFDLFLWLGMHQYVT